MLYKIKKIKLCMNVKSSITQIQVPHRLQRFLQHRRRLQAGAEQMHRCASAVLCHQVCAWYPPITQIKVPHRLQSCLLCTITFFQGNDAISKWQCTVDTQPALGPGGSLLAGGSEFCWQLMPGLWSCFIVLHAPMQTQQFNSAACNKNWIGREIMSGHASQTSRKKQGRILIFLNKTGESSVVIERQGALMH